MSLKNILSIVLSVVATLGIHAQNTKNDSIEQQTHEMEEVVVVKQRQGTTRINSAMNSFQINKSELFKAACCNLGESFTTNASVDVNYNDATTGARQIKLLGLAGTYVQMLTETMPNFRNSAIPYALSYVPGSWMKSIQVSKGAASVKNGFESITGQINIQYLQPEDEEGVTINLYGSTMARGEANADANLHINQRLSTEILLHHENEFGEHDGNNDTFIDMPKVKQWNLQNRWAYLGRQYIFHGGIGLLKEKRTGGQTDKHRHDHNLPIYKIGVETDRYEFYMKHAFVLNHEKGSNIAFMSSASAQDMSSIYGKKILDIDDKNIYSSLLYETNIAEKHNLSTGLSLNYDYIDEKTKNISGAFKNKHETTTGGYIQYTFTLDSRLTAMAGIRYDHSNIHGSFITPRMHVKYAPSSIISLRLSAGKGYRTVHPMSEYGYLLASGRQFIIAEHLRQEEAWNYGTSIALNIPLSKKYLKINADYYYTNFVNQAIIDYDSNHTAIILSNLHGRSYSHTLQIDATYEPITNLSITAAYRRSFVKSTFGGKRMEKPLTNHYKALLTASYKTPLGLWQFDATLQLNGGGRLPTPYTTDQYGTLSWQHSFHSYEQLNLQVTRWFRHFSIYVGGENLTNYKQKNPILNANNPYSQQFEPTMVWAPTTGAMGYIGIRINFGRL